jgi:hypothetical protein
MEFAPRDHFRERNDGLPESRAFSDLSAVPSAFAGSLDRSRSIDEMVEQIIDGVGMQSLIGSHANVLQLHWEDAANLSLIDAQRLRDVIVSRLRALMSEALGVDLVHWTLPSIGTTSTVWRTTGRA